MLTWIITASITFTFYVGPSKARFIVHAGIVSSHSKILRQLIEGPFSEGISRHAELPEVGPQAFDHFLAYAYYTSNDPQSSGTTTQFPMTQRTSTSRLIELLLAKEHRKFRCKSCSSTPELKFSLPFPKCDKCSQDELDVPECPGELQDFHFKIPLRVKEILDE